MNTRRGAALIVLLVTAMTTVTAGSAQAQPVRVAFDFDHGPEPAPDGGWSSGCFGSPAVRGCVTTTGDAVLRPVPRADGSALRFPGEDSAVISVVHDEELNPGRADFSIAARVRLTPEQIRPGANIIQKGLYDADHGQWKLQVDDGLPSCRVSGGSADSRIATAEARADRRLADGVWTSIRCVRDGSRLRLYVAGEEVDSSGGADVTIDNAEPVLIGGKHTGAENDQFRGDLDDVSVTIG